MQYNLSTLNAFEMLYVSETVHDANLRIGLWVIGGILTFLSLEKIFQDQGSEDKSNGEIKEVGSPSYIMVYVLCMVT